MTPPHTVPHLLPPLPCICIFANAHPVFFYTYIYTYIYIFAPTTADPSRGEGSHSPSGPSPRLPCKNGDQHTHKKRKKGTEGGKLKRKAYSPGRQSYRVSVWWWQTRGEEGKSNSPSVISEKRTFSEAERVGSPSSLGPRNPTSTSPLAERNMQTHFIDFWSFAEKPNWIFSRSERASAEATAATREAVRFRRAGGGREVRGVYERFNMRAVFCFCFVFFSWTRNVGIRKMTAAFPWLAVINNAVAKRWLCNLIFIHNSSISSIKRRK